MHFGLVRIWLPHGNDRYATAVQSVEQVLALKPEKYVKLYRSASSITRLNATVIE